MDATFKSTLKVILAAVVFSFSGLLSKWMPWGALPIMGARAVVATLLLGVYRRSFRVRFTRGTVLGAVCVTLTSLLFLMANKLTTAANAIVLQYAMPVFVLALCVIFLHQKLNRIDVVAMALVLLGIVLCFSDSLGSGAILGDLLALMSALTYALVFFASRFKDSDPFSYTFLGNALSSAFLVFAPFDQTVAPVAAPWLVVALMGVLLGGGYILLSSGMKGTSPVTAAIVSNIEPVLNPIWVFLALGEAPGVRAILGAIVVLVTVTLYFLLNRARQEKA